MTMLMTDRAGNIEVDTELSIVDESPHLLQQLSCNRKVFISIFKEASTTFPSSHRVLLST